MRRKVGILIAIAMMSSACAYSRFEGESHIDGEVKYFVAYDNFPNEPHLILSWQNLGNSPICFAPSAVSGADITVFSSDGVDLVRHSSALLKRNFENVGNYLLVPSAGILQIDIILIPHGELRNVNSLVIDGSLEFVRCDHLLDILNGQTITHSYESIKTITQKIDL